MNKKFNDNSILLIADTVLYESVLICLPLNSHTGLNLFNDIRLI